MLAAGCGENREATRSRFRITCSRREFANLRRRDTGLTETVVIGLQNRRFQVRVLGVPTLTQYAPEHLRVGSPDVVGPLAVFPPFGSQLHLDYLAFADVRRPSTQRAGRATSRLERRPTSTPRGSSVEV